MRSSSFAVYRATGRNPCGCPRPCRSQYLFSGGRRWRTSRTLSLFLKVRLPQACRVHLRRPHRASALHLRRHPAPCPLRLLLYASLFFYSDIFILYLSYKLGSPDVTRMIIISLFADWQSNLGSNFFKGFFAVCFCNNL